jgi:hypothetical protein
MINRTVLNKALVDLAVSQVGINEEGGDNDGSVVRMYQSVIGKAEKESWCVSFVQWCVREVDKKFGSKTVLFPTESSQILWLKTPHIARIQKPEPGAIMIWTIYNNALPSSRGHVGIIKEVLNTDYVMTIEGNTSIAAGEPDGVYLKRRRISFLTGSFRTTGFLLPWAS